MSKQSWIAIGLVGFSLLVAWEFGVRAYGDQVFASIYKGETFPSLTETLKLDRRPLEKYTEFIQQVRGRITIVGAVFIGIIWISLNPKLRDSIDEKSPIKKYDLSKTRYVVASLVIAFVVLGQLFDTLINREHWPLSHYPMYTGIQKTEYEVIRVYGLKPDGEEIELGAKIFKPLSTGRISSVVSNHGFRPKDEHIQKCADEYFDWYRRGLKSKRIEGPELTNIRFYNCMYKMSVTDASREITSKSLIAESREVSK